MVPDPVRGLGEGERIPAAVPLHELDLVRFGPERHLDDVLPDVGVQGRLPLVQLDGERDGAGVHSGQQKELAWHRPAAQPGPLPSERIFEGVAVVAADIDLPVGHVHFAAEECSHRSSVAHGSDNEPFQPVRDVGLLAVKGCT